MRSGSVKTIIRYYRGIPEMLRLLKRERGELEDEYNGLRGMDMDGLPHGTSPGKPTEDLAVKLEGGSVGNRLAEINVRIQVLDADAAVIRDCLDALNSKYKSLVRMKYLDGYSWAKISVLLGAPDGTIRRWNSRAVERLGEILEYVPMMDELLDRASRARD